MKLTLDGFVVLPSVRKQTNRLQTSVNQRTLKAVPSSIPLLIRAGFKRTMAPLPLDLHMPDTKFVAKDQKISLTQLQRFHRVTAWDDKTTNIHPCFPHIMAFPLHMQLMLEQGFPFSPVGLVHINQQVVQYQAIEQQDELSINCQFGSLEKHEKGWVFSILTDVYCNNVKVWSGKSDILYRSGKKAKSKPTAQTQLPHSDQTNTWTLDTDLGRKYARASNDYNPIHLFGWTAKLLGFKQPIAHGMWSISRGLSQLQNDLSDPFICECQFLKPLLLPTQVNMGWHKEGNQTAFSVSSEAKEQTLLHLTGNLRLEQSV